MTKKQTPQDKKSAKPTGSKTEKQKLSLIAPNSMVKITIPAKTVSDAYQKNLKKMAKTVKSDGFRKGQAPLKIVEGIIGQGKIIEKALQKILPNLYQDAIKKNKKNPLTQPRFNPLKLTLGEDFELEAHFAEEPEVKLGDYKKIVKTAKKQAEKEIKIATKDDQAKTTPQLTDQQKKDTILQFVFKELIAKLKPAIPQLLVEEKTEKELQKFAQNLSQINIKFEDYLKSKKIKFEQLSSQMAASALGKLQLEFILNKIAKTEKVAATNKEIEQKIASVQNKDLQKKMKKDQYYQVYLKSLIIRQKVIDLLINL